MNRRQLIQRGLIAAASAGVAGCIFKSPFDKSAKASTLGSPTIVPAGSLKCARNSRQSCSDSQVAHRTELAIGGASAVVLRMPNGAPRVTAKGQGRALFVVPTRMWRWGKWNGQDWDRGFWDRCLTVYCLHCYEEVAVPPAILKRIAQKNPAGRCGSFCYDAWKKDVRMICGCTNCGAPLKHAGFVCDNYRDEEISDRTLAVA